MDLGVDVIVRETFHSSLAMGQDVLEALGIPPEVAAERRERSACTTSRCCASSTWSTTTRRR